MSPAPPYWSHCSVINFQDFYSAWSFLIVVIAQCIPAELAHYMHRDKTHTHFPACGYRAFIPRLPMNWNAFQNSQASGVSHEKNRKSKCATTFSNNLLESASLEITSQSLVNSKIDELERSLKHFSLEKSTLFFKRLLTRNRHKKGNKKKTWESDNFMSTPIPCMPLSLKNFFAAFYVNWHKKMEYHHHHHPFVNILQWCIKSALKVSLSFFADAFRSLFSPPSL